MPVLFLFIFLHWTENWLQTGIMVYIFLCYNGREFQLCIYILNNFFSWYDYMIPMFSILLYYYIVCSEILETNKWYARLSSYLCYLMYEWHMDDIYRMYWWHILGVWMTYIWHMDDIYLIYEWHIFDIWMMHGWHILDIWMTYTWYMDVIYLTYGCHTWFMDDIYLTYGWHILDIWLIYTSCIDDKLGVWATWHMNDKYFIYVWHILNV